MSQVSEDSFVVLSPRADQPSRQLPILLQLFDVAEPQIHTEEKFDYLANPNFTDIQPRNHLTVSVSQSNCRLFPRVSVTIHNIAYTNTDRRL